MRSDLLARMRTYFDYTQSFNCQEVNHLGNEARLSKRCSTVGVLVANPEESRVLLKQSKLKNYKTNGIRVYDKALH